MLLVSVRMRQVAGCRAAPQNANQTGFRGLRLIVIHMNRTQLNAVVKEDGDWGY